VLDLYACRWPGQPLWSDEYVLSADEKTSIQARRRVQSTLAPRPHQAARVEHEYERQGAVLYLAAWDVHRAVVFGRCEPKTGKAAFGRLVDQVMDQEPYRYSALGKPFAWTFTRQELERQLRNPLLHLGPSAPLNVAA